MVSQITNMLLDGALEKLFNLSVDFFLILSIIALILGYMLYRGKGRGLTLLVSLHITGLLFLIFPFWDTLVSPSLNPKEIFFIKSFLFLSVWGVVRMIVKGMIHGTYLAEDKPRRLLEAVFLSVIISGVLFSYTSSFLSIQDVYALAPPLKYFFETLFVDSSAPFMWTAASLAFLYFITRKEHS